MLKSILLTSTTLLLNLFLLCNPVKADENAKVILSQETLDAHGSNTLQVSFYPDKDGKTVDLGNSKPKVDLSAGQYTNISAMDVVGDSVIYCTYPSSGYTFEENKTYEVSVTLTGTVPHQKCSIAITEKE